MVGGKVSTVLCCKRGTKQANKQAKSRAVEKAVVTLVQRRHLPPRCVKCQFTMSSTTLLHPVHGCGCEECLCDWRCRFISRCGTVTVASPRSPLLSTLSSPQGGLSSSSVKHSIRRTRTRPGQSLFSQTFSADEKITLVASFKRTATEIFVNYCLVLLKLNYRAKYFSFLLMMMPLLGKSFNFREDHRSHSTTTKLFGNQYSHRRGHPGRGFLVAVMRSSPRDDNIALDVGRENDVGDSRLLILSFEDNDDCNDRNEDIYAEQDDDHDNYHYYDEVGGGEVEDDVDFRGFDTRAQFQHDNDQIQGDLAKDDVDFSSRDPRQKRSRSTTKMFSKIRNNPVLAEALLMDLLQRQQRSYEEQLYFKEKQTDDDIPSADDGSRTNVDTNSSNRGVDKGSRNQNVEPETLTAHHFNTVMEMYINDGTRDDGPQQALRVFYILLDKYYEYRDRYIENKCHDDEDDENGNDTQPLDPMEALRPNFKTYSCLTYALTKIQRSPERAKEVIQLMMKDSMGHYDDNPLSESTVGSSLMEEKSNITSLEILTRHNKTAAAFFNERYNPFNKIPFPDKRFYNSVLRCYADISSSRFKMDDPDSPAARADGFLMWLEGQQQKYRSYLPFRSKLNSFSYAFVIRAWVSQALELDPDGSLVARSSGPGFQPQRKKEVPGVQVEALARAMNVMVRMKTMYAQEGRPDSLAGIPDVHTYYSLISAFGRVGQAHRAEQILKICIDNFIRHRRSIHDDTPIQVAEPNTKMFSLVMDAWSHSDDDEAAERVERLLQRMIKYHDSGEFRRVEAPNIVIYNTVIKVWSRCKKDIAPHRALEILKAIKARADEYGESVRPDVISYTTVMLAFGRKGMVKEVEEVFELMFRDFLEGNSAAEPDDAAISTYLNTLVTKQVFLLSEKKKGISKYDNGKNRVKIDEEEAWCSPERAEAFMERMESLYQEGKLKSRPGQSYSVLAILHAKSGRKDGPDRAVEVLIKMQEAFESGHDRSAQPHILVLNTVLDSFAKAGNVAGAERLFDYMAELADSGRHLMARPTRESYTILINAQKWVKGGFRNIEPEKAERIFREMEKLSKSPGRRQRLLRPDLTSYSSVIDCYAKAAIGSDKLDQARGYIARAEELLDELVVMSDRDRHSGITLTEYPFNTVLKAFAYSNGLSEEEDNIDARIRRILSLMKERNVPPSVVTMNHVQNARSKHSGIVDEAKTNYPRKNWKSRGVNSSSKSGR